MKRIGLAAFLLCLLELPLEARTVVNPFQLFGGYSFVSEYNGSSYDHPQGWQAAIATGIDQFSCVADFAGQYGNGSSRHEYAFGPRLTSRSDKADVFGHALFGGTHQGSAGSSSNGFLMSYGGGVDVKTSKGIAVRVVQFDWLVNRTGGAWDHKNFRFGFGLVLGGPDW